MYLPKVLEVLKDPQYIPLSIDRLAEKMGISQKEFTGFKREISHHLRQGTLVKLKKNRVCLPRDADLITGLVRFRQSGSATLFPDVVEGKDSRPPFHINAEDTGVSMHGDRVVCRIHHDRRRFREQRRKHSRKTQGNRLSSMKDGDTVRVIRILDRANTTLAGTLKRSRHFYFVIPDDPRIIQDILVPDPEQSQLSPKPKVNDKVIVKLAPWEQRHLNPEGDITEILGETHTPFAEYKAILMQYGLNPEFPASVMKEVEHFPKAPTEKDISSRLDFREPYTMTIDPQDAKDFDDALSLQKEDDGNITIGVHIADVSAYVRPGTALDREAKKRGNSTYLVGTVIPMLPHALSNGLCSLVEDENRLTKSVFITFSPHGKLLKTKFANTVIRSNKRLTYEQAYTLLFEKDLAKIAEMPDPPKHQTGSTGRSLKSLPLDELLHIQKTLKSLWSIASGLRRKRLTKGSLELDMPESKIFVDEEGWADRIVRIESDESHQLIEEYMLAANESVAAELNAKDIPAVHRVHDDPDPDKLDEFGEFLLSMDIQPGDLSSRKNLNRLLKKLKDHPQRHMLRIAFLRSLKQACYRATPDGHFGLAKSNYLHFTSPIRRYSDLVVHRIFARHLVKGGKTQTKKIYKLSELADVAQHLSITEQNSTEAERASTKVKLLEFFERELSRKRKRSFAAVVMEVRNHGMFVELVDSMAYGLVHISTLRDDLYKMDPEHASLVGRRKSRRFSVGDKVNVQVARVDRFKRQIDFAIA